MASKSEFHGYHAPFGQWQVLAMLDKLLEDAARSGDLHIEIIDRDLARFQEDELSRVRDALAMAALAGQQVLGLVTYRIGEADHDPPESAAVGEKSLDVDLPGDPLSDIETKAASWYIRQALSLIEGMSASVLGPPELAHATLSDGIVQYTADEARRISRVLIHAIATIGFVAREVARRVGEPKSRPE